MMAAGRWRVAGASVRGTGHAKTGQPCQDFASWEVLPDGTLLVAVADGAGSAAWGQLGAEVGVRAAMEAVRNQGTFRGVCPSAEEMPPAAPVGDATSAQPGGSGEGLGPRGPQPAGWPDMLTQAFHAARVALEAEAQRRALALRDLATTLIVVLASSAQVGAAQVGDGAVVVATPAGELRALTLPAHGEYLNETVFLVSPDWPGRLQLQLWEGRAAGLAALSDGLQMLALRMPAGVPHGPFFHPLFRFLAQTRDPTEATAELTRFLGSAGVRQRTDDDLTLVLAVPDD